MNLTSTGPLALSLFLFFTPLTATEPKSYSSSPSSLIRDEGMAADTFVNYCRLVRAAFFYGQKSTEKKVLSPADLEFFNDNWRSVFDVPYYQAGISADEFVLTEPKLREGNHAPFPPSVRYHKDNADTYLLFKYCPTHSYCDCNSNASSNGHSDPISCSLNGNP